MKVCRKMRARERNVLVLLYERAQGTDGRTDESLWPRLYAKVAALNDDGVSQVEIGEALGVSKQRAGQMAAAGRDL